MSGSLARSSLRHLGRRPGQLLLQVVGIALGIAAVISIDIALEGAERAFDRSVSGVIGETTHQIVAGSEGFDEDLYRQLRVEHRLRASAPIVEGQVRVVPPSGLEPAARASHPLAAEPVRTILGIDPYAESGFRPITGSPGAGDGSRMITRPGGAILERSAARDLGLAVGDSFEVELAARRETLTVVATWNAADDLVRTGAAQLIAVDISTAQELLGRVGRLTRIDLRLDRPGSPTPESLRDLLPPGVEVRRAGQRTETFDGMTAAFRFNLQALGLLSLVIGVFLIHQSVTVSVLARRALWGRLRAMGVSRGEILRLVLAESLVLGAAGSLVGIGVGAGLGQGLVRIVLRTLEDLYLVVGSAPVALSAPTIAKALLLGLAASLLSALVPALEASRVDLRPVLQRSSLEVRARRRARLGLLGALGLLSVMAGLIALPDRSLAAGYGALLALLLAFASATPLLTDASARLLSGVLGPRIGSIGRMALRGVSTQLSRTGPAIAALSVAISMSIGVATMVESFRSSLISWLDDTLPADVYIAAPGPVGRLGALDALPPEIEAACRADAAVERVITNRWIELPTPASAARSGKVRVSILSDESPEVLGLPTEGPVDLDRWLDRARDPDLGPAILVSEPFSERFEVGVGDTFPLRTSVGLRDCPILAVYRDYASDLGSIAMTRASARGRIDAPGQSGVAIFLRAGEDPREVADRLQTRFADRPSLHVRPTGALRRATLEIFDRTFQVTEAIRLLAVVVAAIGVFGALVRLGLERRHELGVLRATGLTRREWAGLVLTQCSVIGGIAGALAMPLGIASAALLTHVVNARSFGWTIDFQVSAAPLLVGLAIAVVSAVLGGLLPALRMGRIPVSDALREVAS
ncbi:MAG: FtsX-like permease family protein [Planctomycetota bacterium]|jgi:putative ABC transport system permease protein